MEREEGRLIVVRALAVSLIALSLAAKAGSDDAACRDGRAISEAIAKRGAARVMRGQFDSEEGWSRLLNCIRTGDNAWLEIALQIQGQLDGGGPGELAMATADALERNAVGVLSLIRRGYSSARVVCGCEGIEDLLGGDYDQAVATIRRRSKAVEAAVSPERRSCLAQLAMLEANVRHWFSR